MWTQVDFDSSLFICSKADFKSVSEAELAKLVQWTLHPSIVVEKGVRSILNAVLSDEGTFLNSY
jgi:hypothetical protein